MEKEKEFKLIKPKKRMDWEEIFLVQMFLFGQLEL